VALCCVNELVTISHTDSKSNREMCENFKINFNAHKIQTVVIMWQATQVTDLTLRYL